MRPYHLLLILFGLIVDVAFADDRAFDEKWGTLRGQVLIEGKFPVTALDDESLVIDSTSRGIANVVVYLRSRPDVVHHGFDQPQKKAEENQPRNAEGVEKSDQVEIEIRNGRFVPHISVVRTGVPIRLVSHDLITHAVQTFPVKGSPLMRMIPANKKDGFEFPSQSKPEKEPIKVIDPTDTSMSAYWVVLDHPYVAVTDNEGKFQIPQLPVGNHKFMIWHERYGYLKKGYNIEVKQGMNELASMVIGSPGWSAIPLNSRKIENERFNPSFATAPYWWIATALILISVCLLLSKPRKSNQKKIHEPTNAGGP